MATGLGQPIARSAPKPLTVVRTGTDNLGTEVDPADTVYDSPAILRRGRAERVKAMSDSGIDPLDIPAFLRKQAD